MIDRLILMRLQYGAALIFMAFLDVFVRLLPLDLAPGRIPGPDLFLALCIAWVLRRPDYVPIVLLAVIFFIMDMLLLRVPGVWTLLVVVVFEVLRRLEHQMREQPFLVEWGLVAATLIAMMLCERILFTVFFVERAPFGRDLIEQIATIIYYPLMVLATNYVFGLRKRQPGEDQISRLDL